MKLEKYRDTLLSTFEYMLFLGSLIGDISSEDLVIYDD